MCAVLELALSPEEPWGSPCVFSVSWFWRVSSASAKQQVQYFLIQVLIPISPWKFTNAFSTASDFSTDHFLIRRYNFILHSFYA